VKQRFADFRFEGRQVLAERRLRHVAKLRRGGDGTVAVDGDKRAVPFEVSHKFIYTSPYLLLFEL
jgi:hypothetical protein